jgi:hypothetical protein
MLGGESAATYEENWIPPWILNRYLEHSKGSDSNPSLSAIQSFSFMICHLPTANSPDLAGKSRFFEQSENRVHRDFPPFVPEFSERNSGSSFSE